MELLCDRCGPPGVGRFQFGFRPWQQHQCFTLSRLNPLVIYASLSITFLLICAVDVCFAPAQFILLPVIMISVIK